MELNWLSRTENMLGKENIVLLKNKTIMVLGVGGVGCASIEALCRCGVGKLILVDNDEFALSNLNRQKFATMETIGKDKVAVAKERIHSINPECEVIAKKMFYLPDNADELFSCDVDYVIDAIDTVTAKLDLAVQCKQRGIPLISCMGTGNRLDPTKFTVGDISQTQGCGCNLAKVMRRELKKRGVEKQEVLFSSEPPQSTDIQLSENGRHPPSSISFVPPVAGYILASHVVRRLINRI